MTQKTEAKTVEKIKVKLLKPVTINDKPCEAGQVVEVQALTAQWLVDNQSAEAISDKNAAKAKG